MIVFNQFANKECIRELNEHQLNNLLNFIKIAVPFVNKDTEYLRMMQWIKDIKSKLTEVDVQNQLFDYVLT